MEHRTKRDLALINLVSHFEERCEKGNVGYLEEKEFYQLIHFYEDEFQIDKALEVVNYALNQFAYRSDFYIIRARLLLKNNQLGEAVECLDTAETIAPYEIEVRILRSRALAMQGAFDQAMCIIEDLKSYAIRGDLSEIYLCESYVYEGMHEFDAMFEALKNCLQIDPENDEALERMWVSVELSKNYESSVDFHNTLINRQPFSHLAWFNLGHAHACLGEYDLAIDSLEYSFLINEDFEAGYLDCAELCFQTKKYKRSFWLYQEANEKFGPDAELVYHMAACLFELRRVDKAKHLLYDAVKMDAYNDEVYYLIGRCYLEEGNWASAASAFHKAIDIDDRREEYYASMAKAYIALDDPSKAKFYFKKSTEIALEQHEYWEDYVQFLMLRNEFGKALDAIDESECVTYSVGLVYQRAIALYALGSKRKAIESLKEALIEDYDQHTMIEHHLPQMLIDKDIQSAISYYEGEQ